MSPGMVAFVGFLALLGGSVGGLVVRLFLTAYQTEKGKNLATKEDVAEITRKIEGVRQSYLVELERIRSDLQAQTHERGTRFARLHERRFDAIDGLFTRLVRVRSAFHSVLTEGPHSSEWDATITRAREAGNEVVRFFGDNRLYFTPEINDRFGSIDAALRDAWVSLVFDQTYQSEGPMPQQERQRRLESWRRGRDRVMLEVPRLIDEIEGHMQTLLDGPRTAELEGASAGTLPRIGSPVPIEKLAPAAEG